MKTTILFLALSFQLCVAHAQLKIDIPLWDKIDANLMKTENFSYAEISKNDQVIYTIFDASVSPNSVSFSTLKAKHLIDTEVTLFMKRGVFKGSSEAYPVLKLALNTSPWKPAQIISNFNDEPAGDLFSEYTFALFLQYDSDGNILCADERDDDPLNSSAIRKVYYNYGPNGKLVSMQQEDEDISAAQILYKNDYVLLLQYRNDQNSLTLKKLLEVPSVNTTDLFENVLTLVDYDTEFISVPISHLPEKFKVEDMMVDIRDYHANHLISAFKLPKWELNKVSIQVDKALISPEETISLGVWQDYDYIGSVIYKDPKLTFSKRGMLNSGDFFTYKEFSPINLISEKLVKTPIPNEEISSTSRPSLSARVGNLSIPSEEYCAVEVNSNGQAEKTIIGKLVDNTKQNPHSGYTYSYKNGKLERIEGFCNWWGNLIMLPDYENNNILVYSPDRQIITYARLNKQLIEDNSFAQDPTRLFDNFEGYVNMDFKLIPDSLIGRSNSLSISTIYEGNDSEKFFCRFGIQANKKLKVFVSNKVLYAFNDQAHPVASLFRLYHNDDCLATVRCEFNAFSVNAQQTIYHYKNGEIDYIEGRYYSEKDNTLYSAKDKNKDGEWDEQAQIPLND